MKGSKDSFNRTYRKGYSQLMLNLSISMLRIDLNVTYNRIYVSIGCLLGRPERGKASLAWRIESRRTVVLTVEGVKLRVLAASAIPTPHLTAPTI